MENREDFVDGYGYGYNSNQVYYDPAMQQGYYGNQGPVQHYGNWGWQGYNPHGAQGHGQAFYGGYHPMAYEYDYSYDEANGYNGNMGSGNARSFQNNPYQGQGQGLSQESSGKRSKYSYSQNRNKNRQRPETRQANQSDNNAGNKTDATIETASDVVANLNVNNNSDESKGTTSVNNKSEKKTLHSGSEVFYSVQDNQNISRTKPPDKSKYRGGRFQGSDSRTREFDRERQQLDRRRTYNTSYKSDKTTVGDTNSETVVKSDNSNTGDNDNHQVKEKANANQKEDRNGAKPKSFKDSKSSAYNDRYGNNKKSGYKNDSAVKTKSDGKDGGKESLQNKGGSTRNNERKGDTNVEDDVLSEGEKKVSSESKSGSDREGSGGGRKKKKELQVYSSSSPRERQGRASGYNSQREAYDRYNYRGQDYNKRHKEFPALGLERGGDRTKLTGSSDESQGVAKGDNTDDVEDSGEQTGTYAGPGRKPGGPGRGTRQRKPAKVDESQRGALIEQLSRGSYECMVCCETVRAQNAVWSCANCYHVFHLRCIKKWARSPNSIVTGSGTEKEGWRCPACQNLSFKFPNQYRCFCGKVRDPEPSRMDTPHSCGDVCQKDRGEGCKHSCNILCHPGPCPECNAMVTKSCDCGKTKQTAKCCQSMTIKCELTCERQLNCGQHFCQAKCHSGPCDKCEVTIKQECYGGHGSREVVCGSEESFQESYSCDTPCNKTLDCGNHTCENSCHPGDCGSCTRLPANVTKCPCGARDISELGLEPRISCYDAIPTCGAVCNKALDCGPKDSPHHCTLPCHEGPCGPCTGFTMLSCRCLFKDQEFKCTEINEKTGSDHVFLCDRRCNRKKTCGRHKCGQPCCVLEEHSCDMVCGRKLSCGLHKCDEPCHKNNCPPCLMASFDELTCHCGTEVMYPPIPCGTKPPECHRPCTREHGCNHQVRHNCHSDEICPPCTELTKKMCMGNHVMRSNIACHLSDISCGMKCSKPLPCGKHCCIRTCHKGPCLEEGQTCVQPCTKRRDFCEHPCSAPCHGDTPCPNTPCRTKFMVKCACGNRESETMCSSQESSEFQRMTLQSLKDSIEGNMGNSSSVNIGKYNQSKLGQNRYLECNEECALLERNRRLALALEIQNPDLTAKLGNPSYSDFLRDFARKDPPFVAGIEKALSDIVQSAKQSKQSSRSHAFASMNMNQRRLVHELAEFYGCTTQSYDYEPKKNVVASATRDKCWLPSITLTAMVQRELHPKAPPPIPHVHKEETLRQTNLASKQSTLLLGERESSPTLAEGWKIIGKKTRKPGTQATPKSAIGTIDKFESNLAEICSAGAINYESLSFQSKEALKSEPVVDYFDFTVN
ncbi:transcriptional repressor NF-X1-like isoform X2 [Mya arenaria]|nr:transcriptional repressor NF-X1-like isoform X2 [Mya arenaria]